MPALAAWMPSPMPGREQHHRRVGEPGDLDLALADADGLDEHDVAAGGVEHPQRLRRRPGQPAEVTARGHRADVDAGVGRVVLHPHPVAEQRAAGERRRRVDREHADPLAGLAQRGDQRGGRRRLADAGRAGDADDLGVAGVRRERRHHLAQLRRVVLDQRDQPGDRPGLAGPGARSTQVVRPVRSALRDTHDQGVALAAAAAQRGRADAAAAALQLEREVQHDAGAGHADRVAERDRAAVDVDLVVGSRPSSRVDAMPTAANASLNSTRSRSAAVMPSLSQRLRGRVGRLHLQARVGAGDHAVRADLGEPRRGRAPRPWPCSSRRRRRRRRRSARRSRR